LVVAVRVVQRRPQTIRLGFMVVTVLTPHSAITPERRQEQRGLAVTLQTSLVEREEQE
jgi:hypothetical protein